MNQYISRGDKRSAQRKAIKMREYEKTKERIPTSSDLKTMKADLRAIRESAYRRYGTYKEADRRIREILNELAALTYEYENVDVNSPNA